MAFKMKGINSLTNNSLSKQVKRGFSPLFETDPDTNSDTNSDLANLDYKDTEFVTEDNIPVKGEAVIPGQKVEKQLVPEDFEGGKNNPEYQKKLAALKIAMEQGKDDKYQDQRVVRERDYTSGLITRPGKEYKGMYYKETEDGRKDRVFKTGGFLSGRITDFYKNNPDLLDNQKKLGDAENYITENEAEQYFKSYNPGSWKPNYQNWRELQGLESVKWVPGVAEKSVYKNDSKLSNYTYSKVDD